MEPKTWQVTAGTSEREKETQTKSKDNEDEGERRIEPGAENDGHFGTESTVSREREKPKQVYVNRICSI
jgi:hypothetical protein